MFVFFSLNPEFGAVFGVKEACATFPTLLVNTVIFLAVLSLCQISWVYHVHKYIYMVYTYTCMYLYIYPQFTCMHRLRYTHSYHMHIISILLWLLMHVLLLIWLLMHDWLSLLWLTVPENEEEEPRVLGLAMVPGHHILSIHVDQPQESPS